MVRVARKYYQGLNPRWFLTGRRMIFPTSFKQAGRHVVEAPEEKNARPANFALRHGTQVAQDR
jgi:hypothetical protein